jgi:hypothetical protein
MKALFVVLACFSLALSPLLVMAQGGGADSGQAAERAQFGLQDPLDSSINSIPAFFLAILDILLVFAIPFVVFFIIYAGFLYVTARGNPGAIEQAHKALLYAIIGGLLIFGARAILAIITNTVNSVVLESAATLIGLA